MNDESFAPIYLRITIDGARTEISSKRYVKPDQWNTNRGKVNGSGEEVRSVNAYLKTMEHEVYEVYRSMIEKKVPLNVTALKNRLLGKNETKNCKMLVPIFEEHNSQIKALVGKEYSKGTYDRYETSLKHTKAFLLWKYQAEDIAIDGIDHEFIMAYDFYLRSQRNCANNSTVKYLKNFKKIVLICIANGWLDKDPFVKYKPKVKEVKRNFLNMEEIENIEKKQLAADRVSQVRDIFLFSCYTGLAYADVKKLKRSEIVLGIDGQKWIYTSRQKTDTDSRVPLLPKAMVLMAKYEHHPQCENDGLLLPVLRNQKMNSYCAPVKVA